MNNSNSKSHDSSSAQLLVSLDDISQYVNRALRGELWLTEETTIVHPDGSETVKTVRKQQPVPYAVLQDVYKRHMELQDTNNKGSGVLEVVVRRVTPDGN